uniref:Smr domain-containing protein n=1 Tax=Musa acuminata subsp. malaccensis TaxID=214687 RepID=A0A804JVP0_MUSAM|nr:PREDICTED: SMR domain-containing protein At5g58720 isoform X2 [Musa acuminata subsp. malaccensis]
MKPSTKKRSRKKKRKPAPAPGSDPAKEEEAAASAAEILVNGGSDDEQKRALNWLIDAFTSVSVDQIASAYREAGGDPFKAAGILGARLDDPAVGPAGGREAMGSGNGFGGSRRHKRVAAATGMVSDVIGKGYSGCGRRNKDRIVTNLQSKGCMNRMYKVEEAEQFLCSMLGDESELGMGVVTDVLDQCGCDIEKLRDRTSDSAYHLSEKEHVFQPFVGYSNREHGLVLADNEVPLPSKSEQSKPALQQKVLESLFNIPNSPKHESNCMNWKKVVTKVESFGQGLEFCSSSTEDTQSNAAYGKEDDYQVFRGVSKKHWDKMRTYYQEAAMAYSRGERAHASYLSEKGKLYRDIAREADEKASREIFETRNKHIKNMVTIDLHGQHVKQAIGLLKLHLLLFTYIPSVPYLKVITGCGADGVGKGKLKHAVLGLVEKEGVKWREENAGTLILSLDEPKEYSFVKCDTDSE